MRFLKQLIEKKWTNFCKSSTKSNITSTDKIKSYSSLVKFDSDSSNKSRRENDFNNYPYMKLSRSVYGIWNSQQIWYALEHNYKPICLSDSPAETVFNKAKSILCEIILEGMTVEEKIFQIYSWFAQNVQYDHQYTNDFYQSVLEKYPEAAVSRAFHAEGALIDGLAVCEGYAKAYLLLLRIEGIESYRIVQSQSLRGSIVSSSNEKVFFVGYKSHAFVAIKLPDGQIYYSDPENSFVTGAEYLQQYQQCLIPSNLYDGYSGIIYFNPAIEFATDLSGFYYNLYLDDKKLFIGNKDELRDVIDTLMVKVNSLENIQVSIFSDVKKYINFQNDIIELLNGFDFKKKSSNNNVSEFTEIIVFK